MYFYYFDQYRGHDRVSRESGYDFDIQAGDMVEIRNLGYILCLGTQISRSEQYPKRTSSKASSRELIQLFPQVMREHALTHLHQFVRTWFTTYKKAIPLWIPEPDRLLNLSTAQSLSSTTKKKTQKPKKTILSQEFFRNDELKDYIYTPSGDLIHTGQTLVMFPDVWTMAQAVDVDQLKTHKDVLVLHQSTVVAKSKAYRKIAQSTVHYVFATYSQIFRDWDELGQVVIMSGDRMYYKAQMDPRYHAVTVASHMADIYGARLDTSIGARWKLAGDLGSDSSQDTD